MKSAAYEAGEAMFKAEPELSLVGVWWCATSHFDGVASQREFVDGYTTARKRKDDYLREKREEAP